MDARTCADSITMDVEALDGGFKVVDSNGQALAYVYGHADPRNAQIVYGLTLDEARRRESNLDAERAT
jgi:hypothetical protein